MSLHLQTRYEQNVSLLATLYEETLDIRERLEALGEEIRDSADPDLLEEVMEMVKEKERHSEESLENLFWIRPNIMGVGIDINAVVRRLTAIARKKSRRREQPENQVDRNG